MSEAELARYAARYNAAVARLALGMYEAERSRGAKPAEASDRVIQRLERLDLNPLKYMTTIMTEQFVIDSLRLLNEMSPAAVLRRKLARIAPVAGALAAGITAGFILAGW